MITKNVVVVDDDPGISNLIKAYLKDEGFNITLAANGSEALTILKERHPDIVLLDIGLPDMDGFEVLKTIKKTSSIPVIVLSSRGETRYKKVSLGFGADDYITKPFGLEELLKRLNAVLYRSVPVAFSSASAFSCKGLFIDFIGKQVQVSGKPVPFSPLEFGLLKELASNAGKELDQGYLLHKIWGPDYSADAESLHLYVQQLRQKIGDDPEYPRYILNVPPAGYTFQIPGEQWFSLR